MYRYTCSLLDKASLMTMNLDVIRIRGNLLLFKIKYELSPITCYQIAGTKERCNKLPVRSIRLDLSNLLLP